jgi:hypothetical protein
MEPRALSVTNNLSALDRKKITTEKVTGLFHCERLLQDEVEWRHPSAASGIIAVIYGVRKGRALQSAEKRYPPGIRCEASEFGSLLPLSSPGACAQESRPRAQFPWSASFATSSILPHRCPIGQNSPCSPCLEASNTARLPAATQEGFRHSRSCRFATPRSMKMTAHPPPFIGPPLPKGWGSKESRPPALSLGRGWRGERDRRGVLSGMFGAEGGA